MISPRQALVTFGVLLSSPRQALVNFNQFASPRQAVVDLRQDRPSPRQAVVSVFGAEFGAVTQNLQTVTASNWQAQCRNIIRAPRPRLTYLGEELGHLVDQVQLVEPLNGKAQLTFSLIGPAGTDGVRLLPSDLVPPGYGDFAGVIRQHKGDRSRLLQLSTRVADADWFSEEFLPTPVSSDGRRLDWGGDDLTALIDTDTGQTLPDIVRATGDMVTAHRAMQQCAELAGIQVECRFPDFLIGELRRGSGSILSWMDQLANAMQAGRRIERGRLIYEQIDPNAPPSWEFVDRLNIQTLKITELPRAANDFVLARFTPLGGQLGEGAGRDGSAIGRQSVSFQSARYAVVDVLKVVNGQLKDFVYFDGSGNPLNGSPGPAFYTGAVEAVRAEFTYEPLIFGYPASWRPEYEVRVRGGQFQRESTYRFTAEDAAHKAVYGLVPAGKSIGSPVFGDEAGAALGVQAALRASTLRVWSASFSTPYLNPFVRPGQVIVVKDFETRQNATRWVVEKVIKLWRGRFASMTIDCIRGL